MITTTLVAYCLLAVLADNTTNNTNRCRVDMAKYNLFEYGYLRAEDETSLNRVNDSDLSNALFMFQEFYNLPTDGELNNETVNLMLKPRCGNADIISDFQLSVYKWNKPVVSWHYYLANQQVLDLTKKAFTLWEQNSGIRFEHHRKNPDILISNKRRKHMMQKQTWQCPHLFNGKSGTLAHAYYPDQLNTNREIHIDEEEAWSYLTTNNIPPDQTSLYATLTHEIGHTLGISHSSDQDAIMFAYYSGKTELGTDDILAIQNLYGKPQNISPTTTTLVPDTTPIPTPSSSPAVTDEEPIDTTEVDLCHFKNINMFLVANKRLYILHQKWLWIINIGEKTNPKPLVITDWLTFLPRNFSKVSTVYQRPSGEIVMFIDSFVYMFHLTNLRLIPGYPRLIQAAFGISPSNLHAIFNSYAGRTYIFHDDNYYREVDECAFTTKSWGYISEAFPGIPPKIDSAFRYTDGNLYFFKNNTVYAFNEFTSSLIKTERNSLSIFGLKCINDDVLLKLKDLLSQLIIQRKRF